MEVIYDTQRGGDLEGKPSRRRGLGFDYQWHYVQGSVLVRVEYGKRALHQSVRDAGGSSGFLHESDAGAGTRQTRHQE